MATLGFTFFDTAIGRCAIAWSALGVTGVWLPGASESLLRSRLRRRWPSAVECAAPAAVQHAIDGMVALLRGHAVNLQDVVLDMTDMAPFQRRVYEVARHIAPGETLSYGELAARLGHADAARAVGQALARNPFPIVVPCHRVLAAHGRPGGFSAPGSVATKRRLLAIEGARVDAAAPGLFDELAP